MKTQTEKQASDTSARTSGSATWEVIYKGSIDRGSYEISVAHCSNDFAKSSWGWGGDSKIILFSSGCGGSQTKGEERSLMIANLLCKALNKNMPNK